MSRSRFVKITHDMPRNPKVLSVGYAARWAWVDSLTYCSEGLTDGLFPAGHVFAWCDREPEEAPHVIAELVAAGLWHEPEHDCSQCAQPPARFIVVHDYLKVQQSAEQVHPRSNDLSAAGTKGMHKRWCIRERKPIIGCRHCKVDNAGYSPGNSQPVTDRDTDTDSPSRSPAASATPLPQDWTPNQTHRVTAKRAGIDTDAAAAAFRDWAEEYGEQRTDWDRTFGSAIKGFAESGQDALDRTFNGLTFDAEPWTGYAPAVSL